MGVLPWSPLAGGWLAGGYRKDKSFPNRGAAPDCRHGLTCPIRKTSANSTLPMHSGKWPTTPDCR